VRVRALSGTCPASIRSSFARNLLCVAARVRYHSKQVGRNSMARVIVKSPAVLSGEPVFRGTRVPFKALTDYLEGGESLGEFLEQYPSVTREAAIAALEEARDSLMAHLG
jgi:uncharacterized protein (DUF433 family)